MKEIYVIKTGGTIGCVYDGERRILSDENDVIPFPYGDEVNLTFDKTFKPKDRRLSENSSAEFLNKIFETV